jgi:NOL1/NOP2/fmu family ribosome biogenesis protein
MQFEKYLVKVFGISRRKLKNVTFIERSKEVRITSSEFLDIAEKLSAVSGVSLFRKGKVWNPKSNVLFLFGHCAKKRFEIGKKELLELFKKGEVKKRLSTDGYVLLYFNGLPVALGFHKNGVIKCMMPKEFRESIAAILENSF